LSIKKIKKNTESPLVHKRMLSSSSWHRGR